MIDELQVSNIALIREATLVPSAGLTVLTGETGAGVACALEPAQPSDADVDGLTSDFRNEFPTVMVSQPSSLEPSSKTQDDGGDKAAEARLRKVIDAYRHLRDKGFMREELAR